MAELNSLGGLHYEMMKRCYNENSIMYSSYGAKGITVCEDWHDRDQFKKWAKENGWSKGLRLNRIDSNKPYEPSNCFFGCKNTKICGGSNQKIQKRAKENHEKKRALGIERLGDTRLSSILCGMKTRCYNKNDKNYKLYGGRGIKICDEWLGKEGTYNFIKWAIKNGWKEYDDITIQTVDRIDPNGDYCPENCRLATMKEQAINKRNTVKIIYNGVEKPLSIFCKEFNIPYGYAYGRIKGKGMSAKSVLEEYNNKKWEN